MLKHWSEWKVGVNGRNFDILPTYFPPTIYKQLFVRQIYSEFHLIDRHNKISSMQEYDGYMRDTVWVTEYELFSPRRILRYNRLPIDKAIVV